MRTAIAADFQFGRGGEKQIPRTAEVFNEMIDQMIDHKVELVIFGGDIYEEWFWFNPMTFLTVANGIKRLREAGIIVYVINGNHDFAKTELGREIPAITPFEAVGANVILEPCLVSHGIINLSFIPWVRKGVIGEVKGKSNTDIMREVYHHHIIPFLDKTREYFSNNAQGGMNLIVFHASIFGAITDNTPIMPSDFVLDAEGLESTGCNFAIGGHFHRRQHLTQKVFYVGSIDRNSQTESDFPTGWCLIELDKEPGTAKHSFVELTKSTTFKTIEFDATTGDFEKWVRGLSVKADYVTAKVKLRRDQKDVDLNLLKKSLKASGSINIKPIPEYLDSDVVGRTKNISAEMSLMDQFKAWAELDPDHDKSGELFRLLEFELGNEGDGTEEHFDKALEAIG